MKDLPVEDTDRCVRLRDHLAILTEMAEFRAQAISVSNELVGRDDTIRMVIANITDTLKGIDSAQRTHHVATSVAINNMVDQIEQVMLSLGLTDEQEERLSRIVRGGIDSVVSSQNLENDLQDSLDDVIRYLRDILDR